MAIPQELLALPQWVAANADAVPLNPRTGRRASITTPSDWGTFEQAVATGCPHVGFVLAEGDPYTIIDLDNKVKSPATEEELAFFGHLVQSFASWTELSRSGRGYHIVVRGNIGAGRKHGRLEVYSRERYIIMTGNTVFDAPIEPRQELLDQLVARMPQAVNILETLTDADAIFTDQEIVDRAAAAANGEKFLRLWHGQWEGLPEYPSQSEADYALLAMLTFYSKNNEQVRRIFRYCALGQRDKATRDDRYLNYALAHLRAKEPPLIDVSQLRLPEPTPEPSFPHEPAPVNVATGEVVQQAPQSYAEESAAPEAWAPGFIGALQHYIYTSSERPVGDIALVTAIGILAGMAGQAYNVSRTGLNQYVLLLAGTGVGKNEISTATERIMRAVCKSVPAAGAYIGPAAFASGQALLRRLSDQSCFVSILGEVGHTLKELNDPRAIGPVAMLRRALLDVYARSGAMGVLNPTVYSDSDKNTKPVQSPSLTLIGETAPEGFYASIGPEQVESGLLPRFLILHYKGKRPPANPNSGTPPPDNIIQHLCELAVICLSQTTRDGAINVPHSAESYAMFAAYDRRCDDEINNGTEVDRQLWNRAHVKALKLAALAAVANNPHNPVIDRESAGWAISLVTKDVTAMIEKFASGEIGQGDGKQLADMRRIILAYFTLQEQQLITAYGVPAGMQAQGAIPFCYLQRRTGNLSSFRTDRSGSSAALKRAVEVLIATGELQELPVTAGAQFRYNGRVFVSVKR